jgi:hypothetical protein
MASSPAIHTWECVGGVLIAFSTGGRMQDAIWDAMIEDLKSKPLVGYLGCTVGATDTTSSQRKKATDTLKKRNMPCSIITDNRFVVGVVTMVSWLSVNIKAHDWLHAMDAIRWIGLSDAEAQKVFEALMRMRYAAMSEMTPASAG